MAFPDYQPKTLEDGTEVLICVECGNQRRVRDWPQCPHEPVHNFGEEPLEPYFDEHISESGEWITTRGQRRAIMNRNHLEYRKKRTDLLTGRVRHFDMGRGR